MSVLYVTSFAPDMYYATGMHLIESFVSCETEGALLVCHEGGLSAALQDTKAPVLQHDLDTSTYLRDWMARNQDIIPDYAGGLATTCDCEARATDDHRTGCHWTWDNRNTYRWFRKIASLEYALSLDGWSHVIWLDSDCRFIQRLTMEKVEQVFGANSIFFMRGRERRVVESGVIGFKRDEHGLTVLHSVIERYRSGGFRQAIRWDDGYQFQEAIARHAEAQSVDIATGTSDYDYVLPGSPLGSYLYHFKGVHGRVLRLMK